LQAIKKTPKKYIAIFLLVLSFFLIGIISAKNVWAGAYGIVKVLEFTFLVYFIAINYKSLNKKVLASCAFASLVFESMLVFLQYLNQGAIGGIFYLFGERTFNAQTPGIANASINGQLFLRPYATFSHPNVLSGFLIISMILLFLFSFKNTRLKIVVILGGLIGTVTLLATLSRAAILFWIIYLIVLFGFWIFEKYKKRKLNPRYLMLLLIVVVLTTAFVYLQNNFVVQRFLTTKLSDDSLVQRQELIIQSWNMFWRSPVLGVGINNFFNNLNVGISNENNFLLQPVHNIFLLILAETGIIGFCLMIFVFIKSIFIVCKKKQNKKYLLLAIIAVISLGMFDHYFLTLQQGQLLLSLVLGIAIAKS
jgi:O-antigen ligase